MWERGTSLLCAVGVTGPTLWVPCGRDGVSALLPASTSYFSAVFQKLARIVPALKAKENKTIPITKTCQPSILRFTNRAGSFAAMTGADVLDTVLHLHSARWGCPSDPSTLSSSWTRASHSEVSPRLMGFGDDKFSRIRT